MYHRVNAISRQRLIHHCRYPINACRQKVTQKCPEYVKGQIKHQKHHNNENRNRKVFIRQHTVDFYTPQMLLALLRLNHRCGTDLLDEIIPHVCQSGISIHAMLLLHLDDAVLNQLQFILVKAQLFGNRGISLNQLCCGKADRNTCLFRMILNLMANRMDTTMHRARGAKIINLRILPVPCNMERRLQQLLNSFIFNRTDGNNGNPQLLTHAADIHCAAIIAHFIHHIQRQNHGDVHLNQLQGQIKISLDIGCIYDIDNAIGLFIQNKISGNDFLTGIGTDGIDSRQIHHRAILLPADFTDFLIYRYSGEIADMLIGACQLVK